MAQNDRALAFVGRLLMAIIFLLAGTGKAMGFTMTVGYFAKLGIPMPEVVTVISIIIEIGGGLALLAGFHLLIVAPIMAVFTLCAALTAHQFWNVTDPAMHMAQMNNFLKNIAIIGGFVMVFIDARRNGAR
jgi:putative oxidoreductase